MNADVHENGRWPSQINPVAIIDGLLLYYFLFCIKTFSASCTSYPDKYRLHMTKWVPVVFLVIIQVTAALQIDSNVTQLPGPPTCRVIVTAVYDKGGWNSVVGIASRYGMDSLGL
jgi:hypothetical protein